MATIKTYTKTGATTKEELKIPYNALADAPTIPTTTSELTNNSGFITKAVSDLTYYYTKTQVDGKVSDLESKISAIPKFAISVVDSLPTSNISSTTIYLKKTSTTETGNLYTEYIYVNNSWESLGTQTLDLSSYATKSYVDGQIADFLTESEVTAIVNSALSGLATVATSGSYTDLTNKPTIPTVNNGTLTIQKNGANVATFTANQSSSSTANITVPTKVSELTNDSGYTKNTGTITGITMNGASKGTSGVVDLGTVLTAHQDISGKLTGTKFGSASFDTYIPYTESTNNTAPQYLLTFVDNSGSKGLTYSTTANAVKQATDLKYFTALSTSSKKPSECTQNGFYYVSSTTNSLTDADGNPFLQYHTSNADFRILTTAYSDVWLQQIATDFRSEHIYVRRKENGTWQPWVEIAKMSDIPDDVDIVELTESSGTLTEEQLELMQKPTTIIKYSYYYFRYNYVTNAVIIYSGSWYRSTAYAYLFFIKIVLSTGAYELQSISVPAYGNTVRLSGTQTITGAKTFSENIVGPNFNSRFATQLVPYGTAIGESADLNTADYLTVGNYYCSANATVATLTNCPTTIAFMMEVSSPLSTTVDNESTGTWVYRLRKLTTYEGDVYYQLVYSGDTAGTFTYGSWSKVAKTGDIPTKTSQLTNDSNYLVNGTSLSGGLAILGDAEQSESVAIGAGSSSYGTAIGYKSISKKSTTTAIGAEVQGKGGYNTLVGHRITASGNNVTAIYSRGSSSDVSPNDYTVLIGSCTANYDYDICVGGRLSDGTPTDAAVTYIGGTGYSSSGRGLMLGVSRTNYTYMNAAGSSWTSASDIRDKTDIEEIDHALDFINKLKPITYVMNEREKYLIREIDEETGEEGEPLLDENGKQQYDKEAHARGDKKKHRRFAGLSAQDTYQAMLDCYDGNTNYAQIVDNNKFDHPDDEYIEQYSMSYERLVPFLIKAMQEQQAQIDELKAEVADLKTKLA